MSLSPEDIQNIARAMQSQPAAAPAGAITANGIVKYQTIIIFCITAAVAVGSWLVVNSVSAATKMTNIERDLAELKSTRDALSKVKVDQEKTSSDVRELQTAVNAMTAGQKEIASDLRAVGQQVAAISQSMRGAQRP